MHRFRNDYMEGACPAVLDAIVSTNAEQCDGYTEDVWCERARAAIREAIVKSDSKGALEAAGVDASALQIEFVCGGTMANLLCIDACLRPYEGVIAAPDGHVNVHETGAIEGCGHKVLPTSDPNGLLSVAGVDAVMLAHDYGKNCHMVKPHMLYFSLATEMGLVHTAEQIAELRAYADEHDLLMYIDGARLACGLASERCDATLADVCAAADVFTIGGTKNGALFGEAIVIRNPEVAREFRYQMKRKGALLAKGRLLGVQYNALMSTTGAEAGVAEAQGDEAVYFSMGRHSVAMSMLLKEALVRLGFDDFVGDSSTNQLFVKLDASIGDAFIEISDAEVFSHPDPEHVIVRLACSWATTEADIAELEAALAQLASAQ